MKSLSTNKVSTKTRFKLLICASSLVFLGCGLSGPAWADGERLILRDFRASGSDFSFLQWKDAVKNGPDGLEIGGPKTKGDGGFGVNAAANVSSFGEAVPIIRLKLGEYNQAARINFTMTDADGTELNFAYDLSGASKEKFEEIYPTNGASLSSEIAIKNPGTTAGFDLENVKGWSMVGDWSAKPVHLIIQDMALTKDIPPMVLESRAKAADEQRKRMERERREAEQQRVKLESLLREGAAHSSEGPQVERVYPLGSNIIGIEIQDRVVELQRQIDYVQQPGDVIQTKSDAELWRWVDGKLEKSPGHLEVLRPSEDGKQQRLGNLVLRGEKLWPGLRSQGKAISVETLDVPAAYRVSSITDSNYTQSASPTRVLVKRKPNAYRGKATLVRIYLELPNPLQVGKKYTIGFHAVNTAQASVTYTHEPRNTRSEAVHVSHIGYRPDDPYKQGKLSLWLGTGGEHDFAVNGQPPRFEVIDETTGEAVHTGRAELAKAAKDSETHINGRNYAQTPVYTLDFSSLNRPGDYRLHVEDIGCSYPFRIAKDTWAEAFRVSMEGILAHRSGIELGPPTIEYRRPRNMHPADEGFAVYPIPRTMLEGEVKVVQEAAGELAAMDSLPAPMPNAWGGYMDAGDWDRRANHLDASYLLLELYEVFPDGLTSLKLNLPQAEAENDLPDILDEALWNLAFYRRLQEPDGGVRGGIESTEHPLDGEASWQESLFVGCFAPDPVSSLRFAAKAAKWARVTSGLRPELAEEYRLAAIKAWDWAEINGASVIDSLPDDLKKNNWDIFNTAQNLAAVELYWLIGDEKYHEAFKKTSILSTMDEPRGMKEDSALFTYARLPDKLGDSALKAKAKLFITTMADQGLAFAEGNSYGITSTDRVPPMGWVHYFSVPSNLSVSVPRAYILTGDQTYLAGTVRAANFAAGCNPDNRALTTGIGHDPVRWPLHLDSRVSGQWAPRGITVCGQSDPAERYNFEDWAHAWIYTNKAKIPDSRTWPAYEAYADIAVLPSMNEYTINAILRNAYNWGILAARPDKGE